jgi:hypothetical protein
MTWAFVVVGIVFAAVIFVRQVKREGRRNTRLQPQVRNWYAPRF